MDAAETTPVAIEEVRTVGLAAGLVAVGACSVQPFDDTRAVLEQRREAGLHGGMQFTYRNPARSTDPARHLPGARSLVVGALGFGADQPQPPSAPAGRVARYATEAHYERLRAALGAVAGHLAGQGFATRVLADDNALVDRAAAHRAGLGWWGRSANLLVPGAGPWVVLGSVLTDALVTPVEVEPVADGCGSCRRCIDDCPTGAIIGPGVVDARRCLAWLVQADGVFPIEHRQALGDRIYGCDTCSEVCPPGRPALAPERHRAGEQTAVVDESAPDDPGDHFVDLVWMLTASDEELLDRLGRWYVPRRDPRYLRRNALVVLANSGAGADREVRGVLERCLADGDPLVRAHAVWAARRLGCGELAEACADDSDPLVRAELAR